MRKNIIFDLDGTLVNSYNGIQHSFDVAYETTYQHPNKASIEKLVGPPVDTILRQIRGEDNEGVIATFVSHFKSNYDKEGFKRSELYSGVEQTLKFLEESGHQLYIATNKRSGPTQLILDLFSIKRFFRKIYSVDYPKNNYQNKGIMVDELIHNEGLVRENTFFVGDTVHDLNASDANRISFIYAAYGYGNLNDQKNTIHSITEVLKSLNR